MVCHWMILMPVGFERGLMEGYRDIAFVFELSSDEELLIHIEKDLMLADYAGCLIIINHKETLNLLQELIFLKDKVPVCHLVFSSSLFKQTNKIL